MGSGAILTEVIKAAQLLAARGHRRRGLQRHELERTGARRPRLRSSARCAARPSRHAVHRAAAGRRQRPDRRRHRLRARRARERPRLPARKAGATSRWAPTASAAATRARRCARFSGWMRRASLRRQRSRSGAVPAFRAAINHRAMLPSRFWADLTTARLRRARSGRARWRCCRWAPPSSTARTCRWRVDTCLVDGIVAARAAAAAAPTARCCSCRPSTSA